MEAMWKHVDTFCDAYHALQLEDELLIEAGADVMVSQVYQHHKCSRN